MMNKRISVGFLVLMLGILIHAGPLAATQETDPESVFDQVLHGNGAPLYIDLSKVRAPSGSSSDQALDLVERFRSEFGLGSAREQLVVTRIREDLAGNLHVRLHQHHNGVAVEGAELIVHFDRKDNPKALTGVVVPDLDLSTEPSITAGEASTVARQAVAEELGDATLAVEDVRLVIFNEGLLRGLAGESYLTYKVTLRAPGARKFVFVDAGSREVVAVLEGIFDAKNRETYDMHGSSFYVAATLERAEGDPPIGDTEIDNAHDFAGDTYDLYFNAYGRDSLNDAGLTILSYAHYFSFFVCPNAFWDGIRMTYCDGLAVDDVVGHELTHGVTEFTANLIYQNQMGALSESLSDIFGETVDLLNGVGNDTAGVRWLVAEDSSIGAIRDMADPPAFGDPDRVGSPLYQCTSGDNGGVHTNSGVPNKNFFLLTDGGFFNGFNVNSLGLTKAAAIHYQNLANYAGPFTRFPGYFIGLWLSCNDLIGIDLNDPLSGLPSGEVLSLIDCFQVVRAGRAVEFFQAACP